MDASTSKPAEKDLVSVMILAACCDGNFTAEEVRTISAILDCSPYFSTITENDLPVLATEILDFDIAETERKIAKNVPAEFHGLVLALAYEVCAADLMFKPQEKELLQELRKILEVSDVLVNALEISIQSRYFSNASESPMLDFPITGPNSLH